MGAGVIVLNEEYVSQILKETGVDVRAKIDEMVSKQEEYRALAEQLENEADKLEAAASQQEEIAQTAMKTVMRQDTNGVLRAEKVPDWEKRAAASALAGVLREHAAAKREYAKALKAQITALETEIKNLANSINDATKELKDKLADMQAADAAYAALLETIENQTVIYNDRMSRVFESIDDSVLSSDAMGDAISGLGELADGVRARYNDAVYERALNIYINPDRKLYEDFSIVTHDELDLLTAYANILGLEVNSNGKVWGKKGKTPIFTKKEGVDLTGQGYSLAIDQWCVDDNPRYTRDNNGTKCNYFVQDVANAMGVPVSTGTPTTLLKGMKGKGYIAITNAVANDIVGHSIGISNDDPLYQEKLKEAAKAIVGDSVPDGQLLKAAAAQLMANDGNMTVRGREKAGSTLGHVQTIRPQEGDNVLWAANAGVTNLGHGLANETMAAGDIKYYYHP